MSRNRRVSVTAWTDGSISGTVPAETIPSPSASAAAARADRVRTSSVRNWSSVSQTSVRDSMLLWCSSEVKVSSSRANNREASGTSMPEVGSTTWNSSSTPIVARTGTRSSGRSGTDVLLGRGRRRAGSRTANLCQPARAVSDRSAGATVHVTGPTMLPDLLFFLVAEPWIGSGLTDSVKA